MDNFLFSLGVMGVGILVVFTGLVILIGFIKILTFFTAKGGKKKPKETKAAAPVAAPPVVVAPTQASGIPAEVIAAITAAIAAMEGHTGFVVRHVKRIANAPAWNRAGREEQTYSRF